VHAQIIDYVDLLKKAGMSFPDCPGKGCRLARVFGGVGLPRTPDSTSGRDSASLKARSDSGYASSLAMSKMTDTSRSEDSGLESDYRLGQRPPDRGSFGLSSEDDEAAKSFIRNRCWH
jgi:hypothetical protein